MAETRDHNPSAHDSGPRVDRSTRHTASPPFATTRRALEIVARAILTEGSEEAVIHSAADGDPELLEECLSLLRADHTCYPPLDSPASPYVPTDAFAPALEWLHANPPGQLGGFMVRDLLGSGATAMVYRGWERDTATEVAIKVIPCPVGMDSLAARFEAETSALRHLWHPRIVRVFAAGVEQVPNGRLLWVAMELVQGMPITEFARTNGCTLDERVDLVLQACQAISHAHQHGIIHRDLKPANLLVMKGSGSAAPLLKAVDFGVAYASTPGGPDAGTTCDRRALVGTLAYMAPEQVGCGESDARSDVYALAAVLYELLANRSTIQISQGTLAEAIRGALRPSISRLRQVAPHVGRSLDAVVHKGLAIDPRRRYASVADFARDLECAMRKLPVTAKPPSPMEHLRLAWRARPVLLAAAVAAFASLSLGLAISALALHRAHRAEAALRAQAEDLQDLLTYLTTDSVDRIGQLPASDAIRTSMLTEFELRLRGPVALLSPAGSDSSGLRRAYARVLERLGDIAMERGDLGETDRYRSRVLALLEPFARSTGTEFSELRADYSIALVKRGDLERARGNIAMASERYKEALAIDEVLAATYPTNRRFMDNLVRSYTRISSSDQFIEGDEERVEITRRALEIAERLQSQHPASLTSIHAVVEASTYYARALIQVGRAHTASEVISKGLQAGQRLCREAPSNRIYSRGYSLAVLTAQDIVGVPSPSGLDAATRDAFALLDAIALLDPGDAAWLAQNNAAKLLLGERLDRRGCADDATRLYRAALASRLPPHCSEPTVLRQQVEFATRLLDRNAADPGLVGPVNAEVERVLSTLQDAAATPDQSLASEAATLRSLLEMRSGILERSVLGELAARTAWEPTWCAPLARAEVLLALGRFEDALRVLEASAPADRSWTVTGYRPFAELERAAREGLASSDP